MNENDTTKLREELWNLVYGLLDAAPAAGLQARITSEPAVARLYAEVSLAADLVAAAARIETSEQIIQPATSAAASAAFASASHPAAKNPVAKTATPTLTALSRGNLNRSAPRGRNWLLGVTASALACLLAVGLWMNRPSTQPVAENSVVFQVEAAQPFIEHIANQVTITASETNQTRRSVDLDLVVTGDDGKPLVHLPVKADEQGQAVVNIPGDAVLPGAKLQIALANSTPTLNSQHNSLSIPLAVSREPTKYLRITERPDLAVEGPGRFWEVPIGEISDRPQRSLANSDLSLELRKSVSSRGLAEEQLAATEFGRLGNDRLGEDGDAKEMNLWKASDLADGVAVMEKRAPAAAPSSAKGKGMDGAESSIAEANADKPQSAGAAAEPVAAKPAEAKAGAELHLEQESSAKAAAKLLAGGKPQPSSPPGLPPAASVSAAGARAPAFGASGPATTPAGALGLGGGQGVAGSPGLGGGFGGLGGASARGKGTFNSPPAPLEKALTALDRKGDEKQLKRSAGLADQLVVSPAPVSAGQPLEVEIPVQLHDKEVVLVAERNGIPISNFKVSPRLSGKDKKPESAAEGDKATAESSRYAYPLAPEVAGDITVNVVDASASPPQVVSRQQFQRAHEHAYRIEFSDLYESYAPGEIVEATVRVLDEQGRPAPGAVVGVRVWNEAYQALSAASPSNSFAFAKEKEALGDDFSGVSSKESPAAPIVALAFQGPVHVGDNVGEIRTSIESAQDRAVQLRGQRLHWFGCAALCGAVLVLVLLAIQGMIRMAPQVRGWAPAFAIAGVSLVLGIIWMVQAGPPKPSHEMAAMPSFGTTAEEPSSAPLSPPSPSGPPSEPISTPDAAPPVKDQLLGEGVSGRGSAVRCRDTFAERPSDRPINDEAFRRRDVTNAAGAALSAKKRAEADRTLSAAAAENKAENKNGAANWSPSKPGAAALPPLIAKREEVAKFPKQAAAEQLPSSLAWQPAVRTDAKGEYKVRFQLPAAQCEYRLIVNAFGDDRMGEDSVLIRSHR